MSKQKHYSRSVGTVADTQEQKCFIKKKIIKNFGLIGYKISEVSMTEPKYTTTSLMTLYHLKLLHRYGNAHLVSIKMVKGLQTGCGHLWAVL